MKYCWLYLIVAVVTTLLSISSCTKDNTLMIRIENDSDWTYLNLRVNPFDEEMNYGNLGPGEISEYKPYEIAYRYAQIQVRIEDAEYVLQPIDYVGETPLKNGKYTYSIGISDLNNPYGLILEFSED